MSVHASPSTSKELPTLLTKKQIAEYLGVTVRSIDRYVAAGELPNPIRIGGRLRWRQQALAEFIERREQAAQRR